MALVNIGGMQGRMMAASSALEGDDMERMVIFLGRIRYSISLFDETPAMARC